MIYDTWIKFQQRDIDVRIFEFLPILGVMNCKEVCSFFTRDGSFTKFYGLLVDNPTLADYVRLKDLFKKRSYVMIDLSVFSGKNRINVQELMDFIVAECCIDRLRMIDLTLCVEMSRLPAFPNIEYAYFTEDFNLMIPSFCSTCIWCKSIKIYMVGCFQLFTRELYPRLNPYAVTVMFCTSGFFRAYCNMSAKRDEIPFLFLDNISSFPRRLCKIRLQYVMEATEEEQEDGDFKVTFGKHTFLLTRVLDSVTSCLVWKIKAFYRTNRALRV